VCKARQAPILFALDSQHSGPVFDALYDSFSLHIVYSKSVHSSTGICKERFLHAEVPACTAVYKTLLCRTK